MRHTLCCRLILLCLLGCSKAAHVSLTDAGTIDTRVPLDSGRADATADALTDIGDRDVYVRDAESPLPDATFDGLPELVSFRATPSDRFIVDLEVVAGGHPYLGANITVTYPELMPHRGAHLHYVTKGWPDYEDGVDIASTYPAIYAPVDAVVVEASTWKTLGGDLPGYAEAEANCRNLDGPFRGDRFPACQNMGPPTERCRDIRSYDEEDPKTDVACFVPYTHYGSGVTLAIAVASGRLVQFGYSIESFAVPTTSGRLPARRAADFYKGKDAEAVYAALDSHLYERFIHVRPGDRVSKGDVIAHQFLESSNEDVSSAHIHYNLWRDVPEFPDQAFVSPSIFNSEIMAELKLTWDRAGILRPEHQCMGVLLEDSENPFSSLSVDNACVNAE